jgi:hypothetical protein
MDVFPQKRKADTNEVEFQIGNYESNGDDDLNNSNHSGLGSDGGSDCHAAGDQSVLLGKDGGYPIILHPNSVLLAWRQLYNSI